MHPFQKNALSFQKNAHSFERMHILFKRDSSFERTQRSIRFHKSQYIRKKMFKFFFNPKKELKILFAIYIYIYIYIFIYIYIYIYIYLYLSIYQYIYIYIYIQLFLNISIYILKKRTRVGHAFFSKECKRTQVLLGFISCKKFKKRT